MTFSYDRAWADIVASIRVNRAALLALTGVFLFLPPLALWLLLPAPPATGSGEAAFRVFIGYYQRHLWAFFLVNAVAAFGQIVILVLLVDRDRPTVAEALSGGLRLFAGYFLANLLANVAFVFGLFLFIVPGLYALGRLAVVGPIMAEQRIGNPLTGLQDSVMRTRGVGWRIVGLTLLIILVGWIVISAATSILTILGTLILPQSLDPMAAAIGNALGSAVLALLLVLLSIGIYRQLIPSNGT